MGLLIGIIRKKFLVRQKSNAEWKLMLITQAMSIAQESANNLLQVGTDYESDSAIAKKLQQRQYKLKIMEEKLKQQKAALELQIKEYTEEIASCEQMINANMKTMFSYQVA